MGGKTAKTKVLPWFCKKEHGSRSGSSQKSAMAALWFSNCRKFWWKLKKGQTFFAKHIFSTLAPSRGYALTLKALIKVSEVSWIFQLLIRQTSFLWKEHYCRYPLFFLFCSVCNFLICRFDLRINHGQISSPLGDWKDVGKIQPIWYLPSVTQ